MLYLLPSDICFIHAYNRVFLITGNLSGVFKIVMQ